MFLDAFILRTMLVPSLMHLFGKANWYLPKWIEKVIPRLSVEPPDEESHWVDNAPEARPGVSARSE